MVADEEPEEITIGRGPENDLNIINPFVSRTHCVIQKGMASSLWTITHVSRSSTYVNGVELRIYINWVLRDGDKIQFSDSEEIKYEFKLLDISGCSLNGVSQSNGAVRDSITSLRTTFADQQSTRIAMSERVVSIHAEHHELSEMKISLERQLDKLHREEEEVRLAIKEKIEKINELDHAHAILRIQYSDLYKFITGQYNLLCSKEAEDPRLVNVSEWQELKRGYQDERACIRREVLGLRKLDEPMKSEGRVR
ncbi:hypothetical protein QAD02_021158 [Eretmocerus hayati]|uniref:Uncharacterized protein n=1 Tax=Eretmocerus hayati TaxID=131215 RepID=A0ACC2PU88_9HYME|nr:hypothetical protein QAD02_021158 [Eretmocerus hayati]